MLQQPFISFLALLIAPLQALQQEKNLPRILPNIEAPSHNPRDKSRTRSADLQGVANISIAQHSTTN